MQAMQKMKGLKRALAVVAVLAMTGAPAWAKKGGNGPGVAGDMLATGEVTMQVSVPAFESCIAPTPPATQSYSIKAYIFQPSGRIFAIGIGNNTEALNCSTDEQLIDVIVTPFPGLNFKPGPATLLFQVIRSDDSDGIGTIPAVDTVVYENGSRIDLH